METECRCLVIITTWLMKAVWEVQYRPLAEPQAQEAEDPRARGQAQKWIGKF